MVTRSGHPFDSLRSLRAGRLAAVIGGFVLFSVAVPSLASAQSSINFNGGASIDPTQVYAGVSWESRDIGGRFRIRPGIDGGFGDGLRLGTINLDLIAKFPLGTSGWTLIQGGGPVISVSKLTGEFADLPRELHAGGSYLFGFQHDSGFFTEFRVGGGGNVPQLKLGVGWAVQIK
jgi:hypothetical protein